MNFPRNSKFLFVLLLSSGLAFAGACGEAEQNGEQQQNQQENDTNQDNGDNQNGNQSPDNDNGNNQNGNNDNGEECTAHDDCEDHEYCIDGNCGDPDVAPADPTPTCKDDDAPDRCEVGDYDSFDFGPATYIDELSIADEDCCVDFTGEDGPDNTLPTLVDTVGEDLGDINDDLAEGIEDGEIAIVLEHDGLEEFEDGAEYDINFLFAEEKPDDTATIDPASFDAGAHPHALLPDAEISDEGDDIYHLSAGPGSVVLSLDLGSLIDEIDDVALDLTISNAQLEAEIDASAGDISDGVVIQNGEIGGLLEFDDLLDAINEFAGDCDCLGNPDPLAQMDEDGLIDCDDDALDAADDQCDEDDICGELANYCPAFGAATIAADIDTTGDDTDNAFSTGLNFSGSATVIDGVAD